MSTLLRPAIWPLSHALCAVYSIDERSAIRKSHENPSIQKLVRRGSWGLRWEAFSSQVQRCSAEHC